MPQGEIYVGAEATNKMELGIVTKAFSRAALQFCGTMVNDLHYSFGDKPSRTGFEIPHLVAPIFPTLDKIIITPDGQTPPEMGKPFQEDPEYRKQRLKMRLISDAKVDLSTTYSFSVNTSNLDLSRWNIVGIPYCSPKDLRLFFGDSSIRLGECEV